MTPEELKTIKAGDVVFRCFVPSAENASVGKKPKLHRIKITSVGKTIRIEGRLLDPTEFKQEYYLTEEEAIEAGIRATQAQVIAVKSELEEAFARLARFKAWKGEWETKHMPHAEADHGSET